MEQVREAALRGLITLLGPNRLSFSRHYYVMLEELLVQLVRDGVEGISQAAIASLLPSLQAWAASGGEEDLLISSLLPRVISDVGRHVRQGAAAATPPQLPAQAGNTPAFQGSSLQYTRTPEGAGAPGSANQPSPTARGSLTPPGLMPRSSFGLASMHHSAASFNAKRFACFDYQAAHQLLEVYCILQATLRECALRKCPASVVDAATSKSTAAATGDEGCQQQEDQGAGAVVGGGAHDGDTEQDEGGGRDCGQEETKDSPQLPVVASAGEQEDIGDRQYLQRSNTGVQLAQPSSAARHQRSFSVDAPGSPHQRSVQQKRQPELSACRSMDGLSSRAALAVEAASAWPSAAEQGAGVADALELVMSGVCSLDDLLVVWLRLGESHIQEAAQDVRPSSQDTAVACRERMLPLLLGSVLPACGEGKLSSWLVFVSNNASHPTNRWLGHSLQVSPW
ncbi:hypothetical protein DUNSADRAFT_15663 [Dunaliella salina]|uniref:Uncharacterized protein n=1 Tax=Dunaliella salina TaxID=3046 RepID=A0ABQ7G4Y6_DUNSA|nr:hypothetical protein DUNSADRAFT_15663 [Dunaliella salina]|eukprot:KAF5829664.1 hypothetical protein DUNSADRAFT_15663 [Dunaliella salina]